jgi:hypothetical protein
MSNAGRVIQEKEYDEIWRPIHHHVFTNQYPPDSPFKIRGWKVVLIPDALNFSETTFNAVGLVARQMEDLELLVDTWEATDGSIPPIAIPWSYQEMCTLVGSLRSHFENHIYGKSGCWGIACSNERDLSYIGGEPKFMEPLVAALGGASDLRRSFRIHNQDFAHYEADFLAVLLRNVGWESS